MKRQVAGFLAAATAVSLLAGCSTTNEVPSASTAGSGTQAASAGNGSGVQLRFSWWGNDDRHQATQKAIDSFNSTNTSGITVSGEPSGFDNLQETFATRYVGGTNAEVMTLNFDWLATFGSKGDGFLDLSTIKDTFDFSQYDENFLKTGMMNGVQEAIPYGQNTMGFYLNKTAFERYGITELPKTFEDYEKDAAIVTAKDPDNYLLVSPTIRFAATYYLQQKTGKAEFNDDYTMNWTAEDYTDAVKWYKDMADKHVFCSREDYVENVGNDPVSVAQNEKFLNAGYLGVMEWTGGVASNEATLKEKGDTLVIAELPTIDGAKFKGTMAKPSLLMAIDKNCKNTKEAAEFLQYILNDPEGVKIMGTKRGMVASKAAQKTLEEDGQITGIVKEAYDFTAKADVINEVAFFESADFNNAYQQNYEQFEYGQISAEECGQAIYDANVSALDSLKAQNQ
ncbi:ABC transporter substrate-binding protein [Oribacterium sp. WCC10]|uniref:ABC transporter substrate-binding protein n=1 Tax=Oribacterium sp. WCC10 TaxID=1855343 RepID=UPI0008EFAF9D|nr:ABC transporter substrate-binding protein [Oribacterium sp. WCC10]SFG20560.1 oligogalacturonide transport system substrate-binding protein [Oribacterium sp. WCC10]